MPTLDMPVLGWDPVDARGIFLRYAVLAMSEGTQGLINLKPRAHDGTEWPVRRKAVGGTEGHHLVEVADAIRCVGILAR